MSRLIKDLNPEIRGYRLMPGQHRLLVPKGATGQFHQRLSGLMNQMPEKRGRDDVYVVKEGDTLSEIAERHRVSVSDVRSVEPAGPKKADPARDAADDLQPGRTARKFQPVRSADR